MTFYLELIIDLFISSDLLSFRHNRLFFSFTLHRAAQRNYATICHDLDILSRSGQGFIFHYRPADVSGQFPVGLVLGLITRSESFPAAVAHVASGVIRSNLGRRGTRSRLG